jgi:hypothetical protein
MLCKQAHKLLDVVIRIMPKVDLKYYAEINLSEVALNENLILICEHLLTSSVFVYSF